MPEIDLIPQTWKKYKEKTEDDKDGYQRDADFIILSSKGGKYISRRIF